jgi:hypothetical protein
MPPSINAYPAQVLFPSPHLGWLTQSTTITWNTGANNILGRVGVSRNGADEMTFEGTPSRSGSKPSSVQLGDVLEFRLRRNDTAKTLLATVKVTTGKTTGLPGVVLEVNEMAGGFSQGIHNLTVAPGVDAVTITFRTRQPTNPFIEIINQDTGKPAVLSKKADKQQVHQLDMLSEGFNPLAQNTQYSYRIVASAMPGSPDPSDAILTGTFRTGSRAAEILFDTIHVRNDGDPGLKGSGEFKFRFSGGDAATGAPLGNVEFYGQASIDSGEDVAVDCAVDIPVAPRVLWAHVSATEDDRSFFDPGALGLCTIGILGDGSPGSSGKEIGACAVAMVTEHFDISQTLGGISERPFQMSTGNFAIAYDVSGRLRVEAHAGEWSQGFVEFRPLPFAQTPSPIGWVKPNGNAKFVQKQGGASSLIISPGGVLYHQAFEEKPKAKGSWTDLGGRFQGPVTAVATAPDRVSLFGLSPDGAVLYKTHSPDAHPDQEWQTLGGVFIGRIIAVPGADERIELFARSEDGLVSHLTLTERGQPQARWERIGGGVEGSMAALFSPRTGLSLFALGRGGEVLYKRRFPGAEWRPGGQEWEQLGVASDGLLSAEWVGEDAVLVAVVAPDETVRALAWSPYPDMPPREGWQILGTVNFLLQGRAP